MQKMVNKMKSNKGFILLFTITLSTIILAIALGVANISVQEINFATSAKDTNDAFFAADTGSECALFHDKLSNNKFPLDGPATQISCFGNEVTPDYTSDTDIGIYNFTLVNLGSQEQGCVKISVLKDNTVSPMNTVITSRGYNIGDSQCNSTNNNRVERRIRLSFDAPPPPNYLLTVSKNGTGTGTISGSGIDCGDTCISSLSEDTAVSLTATADGVGTFAGWSGACSGVGLCNLSMDSRKSVTATFNP